MSFFFHVGRTGFEPATPWSQTMYSTGLNYLPKKKPRTFKFRVLIFGFFVYYHPLASELKNKVPPPPLAGVNPKSVSKFKFFMCLII